MDEWDGKNRTSLLLRCFGDGASGSLPYRDDRQFPSDTLLGDPDPGGGVEGDKRFELLLRLLQGIGVIPLLPDLGMVEEIPLVDDVLSLLAHAPLNFAMSCLAHSSSPLLLADTIATPSRAMLIFRAKSANSFHHFPLIGRSK